MNINFDPSRPSFPLLVAAKNNDIVLFELLVKHQSINLNLNIMNESVFKYALRNGYREIINILMNQGDRFKLEYEIENEHEYEEFITSFYSLE